MAGTFYRGVRHIKVSVKRESTVCYSPLAVKSAGFFAAKKDSRLALTS